MVMKNLTGISEWFQRATKCFWGLQHGVQMFYGWAIFPMQILDNEPIFPRAIAPKSTGPVFIMRKRLNIELDKSIQQQKNK